MRKVRRDALLPRKSIWYLAIAIGGAAIASPNADVHEPALLERARRVVVTDPSFTSRVLHSYVWFAQNEVLYIPLGSDGADKMVRLDVNTSQQTPYPLFDRAFRSQWRKWSWFRWFRLSPTGHDVLWGFDGNPLRFLVTPLTVFHPTTWRASDYQCYDSAWLHKGRRWVALVRDKDQSSYALVGDVDAPNKLRTIPLTIEATRILGVTNQDQLITTDTTLGLERRTMKVKRWTLAPWSTPAAEYTIVAPRQAVFSWAVASPTGDRMAYLVEFHRDTVLPKPVSHRFHSKPSSSYAGIWVSRINGTGMRLIGVASAEPGNGPWNLQWTPDGKHLSFTYRGTLWIIDAG